MQDQTKTFKQNNLSTVNEKNFKLGNHTNSSLIINSPRFYLTLILCLFPIKLIRLLVCI